MGFIASLILHAVALCVILLAGYLAPGAVAALLSFLDNSAATVGGWIDPTGVAALILQFAGAGFAITFMGLVIILGIIGRKVAGPKVMTRGRILIWSLVPLFAHAVRWGLGFYAPALLVPVMSLSRAIIGLASPEQQVQLSLVHAEDHLQTFMIGLGLITAWLIVKHLWSWFFWRRNNPQPQPPAPAGKRSTFMSNIFKPFTWVWSKVRKNPAPTPAPVPTPQKPSLSARFWNWFSFEHDHDMIMNPITWTIFLLALCLTLAFVATAVIALMLEIVTWLGLFDSNLLGDNTAKLVCLAVIFLLLVLEEDTSDHFKVPSQQKEGAQLTWIGMVSPFILSGGTYPILGKKLGFAFLPILGTDKDGKTVSRTISNAQGFLYLGPITFQVWHSPTPKSDDEKTTITVQTGDGATASGNLSLVLKGQKRILWANGSDTGLEIGNRARQELGEILSHFVDRDVKSIQGDMQALLRGESLITAFLPTMYKGRKAGSMIYDCNGKPIYQIGGPEDALLERITKDADPDVLAHIVAKNGGVQIKTVKVSAPLSDLLLERGYSLESAAYDSVRLAPSVEEAAVLASAEEGQAASQIASAETQRQVQETLRPTDEDKNDPNYQLRAVLAAAQDNPGAVKVIHLTGGNPVTNQIAAGQLVANQTKGT